MKKVAPHHITQARHYRQQGLTQKEIGRKIGLSKSTVTRILAGGYKVVGDNVVPVPVFPSDGIRYTGSHGPRQPEQMVFAFPQTDGDSVGTIIDDMPTGCLEGTLVEDTTGNVPGVPLSTITEKLGSVVDALADLVSVLQQATK